LLKSFASAGGENILPLFYFTPSDNITSLTRKMFARQTTKGLDLEKPLASSPTDMTDTFHDKLMFVLLLSFGMPAISTAVLAYQSSMIFWVGRFGRILVPMCVIWVLVGFCFSKKDARNRQSSAILLIVLPTCALMIYAQITKLASMDASTQLKTSDCRSFTRKLEVEAAWQAAFDIRAACVADQVNQTGSSETEVSLMLNIKGCRGYKEGLAQWQTEWDYLEGLEKEEYCAGWCSPAHPLWVSPDNHAHIRPQVRDRCSLAAAYNMDTQVRRTTRQIVSYSLLLMILLGVLVGGAGM